MFSVTGPRCGPASTTKAAPRQGTRRSCKVAVDKRDAMCARPLLEPILALVRLIQDEEAESTVAEVFESGRTQYGRVLNTWRAIAHSPQVLAAYLPYLRAVAGPGALEQRVKELTAVHTAVLNRCRYSASHRVRSARAQGIADAEIVAAAAGRYDHFPRSESLALRFARELTLNPPDVPFASQAPAVDEQLLADVKSEFSDREVVELALNVSLWNALARFHRVMSFDLDMDPPPEEIEKLL